MVAAQDWGAGLKSGEQLLNGYRVSFWGDENVFYLYQCDTDMDEYG